MTRIAVTSAGAIFLALLLSGCGNDPAKTAEDSGVDGRQSKTGSSKTKSIARTQPAKTDIPPPGPKTKSPVRVVDSPGRRLTAWVLKKGGYVAAYIGKKQATWRKPVELPPGNIEPHLIKLEGAVISAEDMQRFAGQPRLRYLYLNRSTVTDDGLKHLKDLPKLEALQLVATKVTDAGMKHLAQLPNLQGLYVASTQVGDDGLKEISKLPAIRYLWVINANVTDAGLVHVGKMKSLDTLIIGGNNITDRGLEHLKGLTSLRHCDLRNTKVTKSAGKALDEALPKATVSYNK